MLDICKVRLAAFLDCVVMVLAASPALAEEFRGKVVGVTDGDTISVLRDGRAVTVRLQGIDAPERRQPFGTRAKQYASGLAFGQIVTVQIRGRDRNGRILGEVQLPDGRSLNHEIVRAGFAWWFRRYSTDASWRPSRPRLAASAGGSGRIQTQFRRGSGGRPCARGPDVHLDRSLTYEGPWLQLLPDSAEDCERLEALACAGVRTGGLATEAEQRRFLMLIISKAGGETRAAESEDRDRDRGAEAEERTSAKGAKLGL